MFLLDNIIRLLSKCFVARQTLFSEPRKVDNGAVVKQNEKYSEILQEERRIPAYLKLKTTRFVVGCA